MSKKARKLNPKQLQFCKEYIIDLNCTQAAIRAGYSKKTARQIGSKLLTKLDIQEYVSTLFAKRAYRNEISADRVLAECMRVALSDVGGAFDENGALLPIHEIPEDLRRAISGIEVTENWEFNDDGKKEVCGELKKVKFWSKDKQIEILFKHLNLFESDNKSKAIEIAIKMPAGLENL